MLVKIERLKMNSRFQSRSVTVRRGRALLWPHPTLCGQSGHVQSEESYDKDRPKPSQSEADHYSVRAPTALRPAPFVFRRIQDITELAYERRVPTQSVVIQRAVAMSKVV